jgi:hypothetical protein
MAMQTSGPISIQDLKIFFGAGATRGMSDFYRGGTFVPDIAANSGIPTSGEIALSDFYGAEAQRTVTVSPTSQSANGTSSSHTWNPVTVSYAGGIPSSVVWSFAVTSGGTFSYTTINGGLTAIPSVSGVVDSCSGTLICTVTFVDETKTANCFLSYFIAGGPPSGGGGGFGGGGFP